ncbi:MAG TPA: NAD(P)H-binding protein [Verrucomicrobiae bacterium]
MKIAITGGTGFVGKHLARRLVAEGHEVVLIARGADKRDTTTTQLPHISFRPVGTSDEAALTEAFQGCDAVAHCAGINREIGEQTYANVHVQGTRNVVTAAQKAGVKRITLMSFLRARPDCGSGYHESKWAAEEIVRASGLDYTILKAGVIYGDGDHMLDHLSHAFHTFPVFAFVGFNEQLVRPCAVEDVATILEAALVKGRLAKATMAVTGPEELTLSQAVRRVAKVAGKRPFFFRAPLWFHYAFGWVLERVMTIPLIATAQVRILSEGVTIPLPYVEKLPEDLKPRIPFSETQIRKGLPAPKGFGREDCLCWQAIFGRA